MIDTAPVTAELNDKGNKVLVTFDYNPQFVKLVKQVPDATFVGPDKAEGPAWKLHRDLPTMRKLREVFGAQLQLGDKLREWGREQVAKEKNLTSMSQADDADLASEHMQALVDGVDVNGKHLALRPYQKADIAFMSNTNVINANQPRTGKTITTIGAIIEGGMEWGQHLILAPKASLYNVWLAGIKETYEAAGLDEPVVLTGATPKERKAAVADAKELADEGYAFWLVLNPAMARMHHVKDDDKGNGHEELVHGDLANIAWDSMTIDEFHLMGLSNPSTLGAKGVNYIAQEANPARRYALSGTPMGGKPVKLWGALHFLNPEEFTSRWHWARHWLVINTNGYGSSIEGIMPGREVDFYNHLKPYLVRRTQREALPGLPPRQVVDVWCEMTTKQAEQYKVFASEAEWALQDAEDEGRLSATNVLAQYTRLKQFANAYCEVYRKGDDSLRVQQTADSGKLEQLIEKLREENVIVGKGKDEEAPKCAVVFSQFNEMVDMVADALEAEGVPTAKLTGKTSDSQRTELVRQFQAQDEGAPRVMVMNTMAGGSAITLDRAETVHMLDETWVPDNQEQAENRITPTTKERMERLNIGIYYYRTKGTIEEYIATLVADKQMNNRTILDLRRRMQAELEAAEAAAE